MTVSRKITVLAFSVAIALSCLLTTFFAHQQYRVELDNLVETSLARVLSRPQLQIDIYQSNQDQLGKDLDSFLEPPAVSFATAYNFLARPLAMKSRISVGMDDLPAFRALRGELSAIEPGLRALDSGGEATGMGFWSSLGWNRPIIHLTIPVFSAVNPTEKGLERSDFAAAMTAPRARQSLVVIGYIHLGIDSAEVRAGMSPAPGPVFFSAASPYCYCVPLSWCD